MPRISYDDFLVWYKSDEKWEGLHLDEEAHGGALSSY
jgi:hypothetical protein